MSRKWTWRKSAPTAGKICARPIRFPRKKPTSRASGYKQAQANLAASDANVRRLEQLEGFKRVYAPFSGVLTKRNVDPGALINAGAGATGRELFDIARVDPLRVYTSVPQAYAAIYQGRRQYDGDAAGISRTEIPAARSRGLRSPSIRNTRTLLTEVDVPNKDQKLLPGSFGEVHFAIGSNVNKVTVPVNAMLFRAQGAQVAVIGSDNKVQLKPINIGKDYGATLEVLGGVSIQDQIVINPSDSLEDGQQVNLAAAPSPGQGQTGQQPQTNPQGAKKETGQ